MGKGLIFLLSCQNEAEKQRGGKKAAALTAPSLQCPNPAVLGEEDTSMLLLHTLTPCPGLLHSNRSNCARGLTGLSLWTLECPPASRHSSKLEVWGPERFGEDAR